jgi:hypothetical protein
MDRNEAPADKRKPPANGDSPILSPPRHGSTLPYSVFKVTLTQEGQAA